MSRSSYSDEYGDEFPGQLELYRANVKRSIKSQKGQARLRELRDALLALPVKELEADVFAGGTSESPRVCALGAWALAQTGGDVAAARAMVPTDADDNDTAMALKPHGWPSMVVFDAIFFNDEDGSYNETPAQRYARVLRWVERQLEAPPSAGAVDPVAASHHEPPTRDES